MNTELEIELAAAKAFIEHYDLDREWGKFFAQYCADLKVAEEIKEALQVSDEALLAMSPQDFIAWCHRIELSHFGYNSYKIKERYEEDGATEVRFVQDPEEWTSFYRVFRFPSGNLKAINGRVSAGG